MRVRLKPGWSLSTTKRKIEGWTHEYIIYLSVLGEFTDWYNPIIKNLLSEKLGAD